MPGDTRIRFPDGFRFAVSPDLAEAREGNREWARAYGIAVGPEAVALYDSWDLARVSACMYPYATGSDLRLVTDHMGFWYPFDDQFDSPLGLDPAGTARACEELIAVVHLGSAGLRPRPTVVARAFADIWERGAEGMSPAWKARAAHNWEYYFASYAQESAARREGIVPDLRTFLRLRIGVSAMSVVCDLCERTGGYEVPAVAFHSLPLIEMRRLTEELPCLANDVYTLDREEPRGDVVNLVLVLEKERGCSRDAAIGIAYELVDERLRRFDALKRTVPALGRTLGLDARQRADVERYALALEYLVSGYMTWGIDTGRHFPETVVPPDRPGYPEDLLLPAGR
ncbi:terpene synthase family protein [Streptomyces sp. I05A-00742]|uniref:terpene synthase family protein n=1 Tax=Streptomyces sp. I05A-00742 TaxID=2732853 RepID=UPI0014893D97|nr:terpene synthase family protein [Streptomyces sp. I05A-00742]